MTNEEAKANIGNLVMSRDAGYKMIASVRNPHGPYRLVKVLKCGDCILEPEHGNPVPPSLLEIYEAD